MEPQTRAASGRRRRARPDIDSAGMIGLLLGVAALIVTLAGLFIPLVPWIAAGGLGLVTLGIGCWSESQIKYWVIGMGALAMVPLTVFLLVQYLPRLL